MQDQLGLNQFYVADLDGIQHQRPDWHQLRRLIKTGANLMIDAGFRRIEDSTLLKAMDVDSARAVLGTESFEEMDKVMPDHFAGGIISIDLRNGLLQRAWQSSERPHEPDILIEILVQRGFKDIIVLDVAAVGTSQGIPTLPLITHMVARCSEARLITGGGVRSEACLAEAHGAGVHGLLVASAIHNGTLGRTELERFRDP